MVDLTATGDLDVTGTSTLNGDVTAANLTLTGALVAAAFTPAALAVTNDATVGGTLDVTGATTVDALTATGDLNVTGASAVAALTASGATALNGGCAIDGTLSATGVATFGAVVQNSKTFSTVSPVNLAAVSPFQGGRNGAKFNATVALGATYFEISVNLGTPPPNANVAVIASLADVAGLGLIALSVAVNSTGTVATFSWTSAVPLTISDTLGAAFKIEYWI